MKTLILLRHAKSSWKYPELQDIERPLNKRGRKDAPKIGKWLKANCGIPDRILCSPSVRTLSTISKVSLELGLKEKDYQTEPALYHASPSTLWKIVSSTPDEAESLLLVGHNPGFTTYASQLCPSEKIENIPTCGVFAVKFHCSKWEDVQQSKVEFWFFQYPKNL